jgi:hypothetical protein
MTDHGLNDDKKDIKGTCKWNYELQDDGEYTYPTECGNEHYFSCGDIKTNEHKYCPYCGKEIEEIKP